MAKKYTLSDLAINGGAPVRNKIWPPRRLFGLEEKAAVDALFDAAIASGNAFGYDGPTERAYCEEYAQFMGGGYVDAVNAGTTAVYVALKAVNPEPYSEIIVSPITDQGGLMPIPLLNCIPVVADAAPGSFNMGPEQIEAMITPYTSAILVAHIMGEPADMKGIMAVAEKYGLAVIEDCAQAHGATINGQLVGTFGTIGAFSTMFGKHHATGSQGGLVYAKDEALYIKVRHASDRGKPFGMPGATNQVATLNFNLGDLGAAIGRVQLKKLPQIVSARRAVAAKIGKALESIPALSLPKYVDGAEPSFWYLRVHIDVDQLTCTKREFCAALSKEGVVINPEYAAFPHLTEWFRERRVFGSTELPWSSPEYKGNALREYPIPNAKAAVAEHFLISVHESFTDAEVDEVITALEKVACVYSK
jgi:perosamine synthetase